MTASEAKQASYWNRFVLELENKVQKIESTVVQLVWGHIIVALKRGDTSCILYVLPESIAEALRGSNYKIEKEVEEDLQYYVVYWE